MIQVPSWWACARYPCAVVQWTTISHRILSHDDEDDDDEEEPVLMNRDGKVEEGMAHTGAPSTPTGRQSVEVVSSKWFLCRILPTSPLSLHRQYRLQPQIVLSESRRTMRSAATAMAAPAPSPPLPPLPSFVQRLVAQDCAPAEEHTVYFDPGAAAASRASAVDAPSTYAFVPVPPPGDHRRTRRKDPVAAAEKVKDYHEEEEFLSCVTPHGCGEAPPPPPPPGSHVVAHMVLYCPLVVYAAKGLTLSGPRQHTRSTPAHLTAALMGKFVVVGASFSVKLSWRSSQCGGGNEDERVEEEGAAGGGGGEHTEGRARYEVMQLERKAATDAAGGRMPASASASRGVIALVGAQCKVRLNDAIIGSSSGSGASGGGRGGRRASPPSFTPHDHDHHGTTTDGPMMSPRRRPRLPPIPFGLEPQIRQLHQFLGNAQQQQHIPSHHQQQGGGNPEGRMGAWNGILIRGPHGCGASTIMRYGLRHTRLGSAASSPSSSSFTTTAQETVMLLPRDDGGTAARTTTRTPPSAPAAVAGISLDAVQVVQWAPGQMSVSYVLEHVVPKARLLILLLEDVGRYFPQEEPELAKLSMRALEADFDALRRDSSHRHAALRVTVVGVAHQYGSTCATAVLESFFVHPHIVVQLPDVDQRAALIGHVCADLFSFSAAAAAPPRATRATKKKQATAGETANKSTEKPNKLEEEEEAVTASIMTRDHLKLEEKEEEEKEEYLRIALELVGRTRREVLEYAEVLGGDGRGAANKTKMPPAIRSRRRRVTTWQDIGGLEEVKRELQQALVMPQRHRAACARFHLSPPSGVLLYGPPGCAKTTLVKALCAEGIFSLLYLDAATVMSAYVGESERLLRDTFQQAAQQAPCIVFFDEVEVLGAARESSGSGGGGGGGGRQKDARLLSTVLTEMDGFASRAAGRGVCFVGATNAPHLIDAALLRPGRMDRLLYIPLPAEADRADILRLYLGQTNVNIPAVARATEGFSGADLKAFCAASVLALWSRRPSPPPSSTQQSSVLVGAAAAAAAASPSFSTSPSTTTTLMSNAAVVQEAPDGGLLLRLDPTAFFLEEAKKFPRTRYHSTALESFRQQAAASGQHV